MVLIVALIALYKWGELQHGIFVGLAIDAGVLIVFAIMLVTIALWIAKKDGKTITPPNDGARTTPDRLPPVADASQSAESFASYRLSSAKAEGLGRANVCIAKRVLSMAANRSSRDR